MQTCIMTRSDHKFFNTGSLEGPVYLKSQNIHSQLGQGAWRTFHCRSRVVLTSFGQSVSLSVRIAIWWMAFHLDDGEGIEFLLLVSGCPGVYCSPIFIVMISCIHRGVSDVQEVVQIHSHISVAIASSSSIACVLGIL